MNVGGREQLLHQKVQNSFGVEIGLQQEVDKRLIEEEVVLLISFVHDLQKDIFLRVVENGNDVMVGLEVTLEVGVSLRGLVNECLCKSGG